MSSTKNIAIAKEDNKVSNHFGHCSGFEVLHISNGSVTERSFIESPGHKPGFLPKFLTEKNIHTIIAGGMGGTAQDLFKEHGISVIVGAQGLLEDVINAYIAGRIESTGSVCVAHSHSESCETHD